ncbi:unnamed protein product, partial [Lymnaea stagnalis]
IGPWTTTTVHAAQQSALIHSASITMAANSGDNYFSSYNDLSVHELMLKDRPRTLAYRNFFETNRELVKDKVVLDVGAGTGILSLFAALAGAKKVYAVEASGMASLCREIVEENHLENIIEVIHGAVEDVSLTGHTKVDVIVSEWMGFYLLHESMLDSVIVARDRFLAPNGILAPSHATLYMAPVDMSDHFRERAEEWSNIYGFDFSPFASQLNMDEVSKPLIQCISPSTLRADPQEVLTLNMKTVTLADVRKFSTTLTFPIKCDSKIFAFAAWFNISFCVDGIADTLVSSPKDGAPQKRPRDLVNEMGDASCLNASSCGKHTSKGSNTNSPDSATASSLCQAHPNQKHPSPDKDSNVTLKTGPLDPPTHWKQTVIFLPQTILVESGVSLCSWVKMAQDPENRRHYNITLQLVEDDSGECLDSDDGTDPGSDTASDEGNEGDHPVPCSCGSDRCKLMAALVSRMDREHQDLGDEAETVELEAQVNNK